ncbi:MAG: hypothetical protein V2A65_09715 [Candidatus Omnitrophota bacterium]
MKRVDKETEIKKLVEKEAERTGGIFRLTPAWVGRPGIIIPGRRIKLLDDYLSQDVVVNERWLASATYADNGVYNKSCPPDHGLSYVIIDGKKVQLKDILDIYGNLVLGKGRRWDVLTKFFDNWHRIPNHLHPCDQHVRKGLKGKPESYYFPLELNLNRNAFPSTYFGSDPSYSDRQILNYLQRYFQGDNRLADLSNAINLIPGTGWFMPPCTLHAPGSLVTYELQSASDVSCVPESRVNDMVMPPDLIDKDLPVDLKKDGKDTVFQYILNMIKCPNSGNRHNFRQEYFRPPVKVFSSSSGRQDFVVYRTSRSSEPKAPDYYSAKRTVVYPGKKLILEEKSAFGIIVLRGHGKIGVPKKEYLEVESPAMYETREETGADEVFVSIEAAKRSEVICESTEPLSFCQHFASRSNPEATGLAIPEFLTFTG